MWWLCLWWLSLINGSFQFRRFCKNHENCEKILQKFWESFMEILRNFKNISIEKMLQKKFGTNLDIFLWKLWEFYAEILRKICGTCAKNLWKFRKILAKILQIFSRNFMEFLRKICKVYEKFWENVEKVGQKSWENYEKFWKIFL